MNPFLFLNNYNIKEKKKIKIKLAFKNPIFKIL